MRWMPFVMVRIAAFFTAGVVVCIYQPNLISTPLLIILFIGSSLFYFLVAFFLHSVRALKLISGFVGLSSMAIAGYLNVLLRDESRLPDHLLNQDGVISAYRVKLLTPAEEKAKSLRRTGSVESILTPKGWKTVSGRVNLYWPKDEPVLSFDYGDVLLIKGHPVVSEAPYNPYEFDFRKHLGYKNIYHQQYVRHGEWQLIDRSTDQGFLFYAHRARRASVSIFRKLIHAPQEQGILMALVLGVTDGLDTEILSAYSASGAMHVLAVSGLHVSIIYGILIFFFRPFRKHPAGEWTIAIVSLLLLWGYAFVTGLSPSVLRAVTMFSFVAISKPLGRNTNIYNTLAASALCLLLYDPFLLMSVGFQLSYLAVLGIVYLQRPIQNLWAAPNAFLHWAWQISSVSIAAQIATLALGIYYFHQFPLYFLVSNLFVIPASCVVLVGGILLLLISPFALLGSWLATALEWFAWLMNEGIFLTERLPWSVIDRLSISTIQCYVLFLLILGSVLLVQFRKFNYLVFMFVCVLMFSLVSWLRFHDNIKPRWIVYRIQGHRGMEWGVEGKSYLAADSSLLQDYQKIKFHIQPNQIARHFVTGSSMSIPGTSSHGLHYYRVHKKTFMWIRSGDFQLPEQLKVDYLVVSNDALSSLQEVSDHIDFKNLILDGSNSFKYCMRLERQAAKAQKSCYSVLRQGAFLVQL